jgi:CheY-like chemotaxis protein
VQYQHPISDVKVIMHVEDDPVVLNSVRTLLLAYQFAVVSVADGEAAVRAVQLEGVRPDLLIVDFHLGTGMNGTDVAECILSLVHYPLPIVLLTGDAPNAYGPWTTKAPVWLLPKPLDARLLVAAIGPLTDFTRAVRSLTTHRGCSNEIDRHRTY